MSIFELLGREIHEARSRQLEIVQIRASTAVPRGIVGATPIAPERLRVLKPYVVHLFGRSPDVFADPVAEERWREIVLHPADFMDLRKQTDPYYGYQPGEPDRVFGIPVRR